MTAVPGSARAGKFNQPYDWIETTKIQPHGGFEKNRLLEVEGARQICGTPITSDGTKPRGVTKQSYETKRNETQWDYGTSTCNLR